MNTTIRRIAVSGSAAVALLGGAAAIGVTDAPTASAADMHTAIDHTAGAPVTLPDGRTMRVRGLDNAAYLADASHQETAVALASAETVGSGATPAPNVYTPAVYNEQVTQSAAGGTAIGVGIVAIIVLGLIVFFRVKNHHLKIGDAVVVVFLGVALSGTVVGAMATQMTNSGVGSLSSILGGLS